MKYPKLIPTFAFPILVALAALVGSQSALAQVWQNGGDSNWNNTANWTTGNVPDTLNESATFTAAGSTTPTISTVGTHTIQHIVFNGDTNFTITGAGKDSTTLQIDAFNGAGITGTTGTWTTQTFSAITVDLNDSASATSLSRFVLGDGKTVVFDNTSRFRLTTDFYYGTSTGSSSNITFNGSVELNRDFKRGSDALAPAGTGATTLNLNATDWSGTSDLYVGGVGSTALTTANIQSGVLGTSEIRIGNDNNVVQLANSGITTSAVSLVFNASPTNAVANATAGTLGATYASGTSTWTGGVLLANHNTAAKTNTFNVANANATLAISGTIGLGDAARTTFEKTGAGTLDLTAAAGNTFAAINLNIVGGTLLVSNTSGSGTGATSVNVKTGGTLGGTGIITPGPSKKITVESGGQIAPGASIGTLRLNGANTTAALLTMDAGAEFTFELDGSGGTPDRIDFWTYAAGDLVLNSNEVNLTLSGTLTPGNYTVSILRFFSNLGATPVNHGITSGLTLGTLGAGISGTPFFSYTGSTIDLTYTVIPEPSTFAMILGGMGLLVSFRRFRRR